jgi:hypothetical protein
MANAEQEDAPLTTTEHVARMIAADADAYNRYSPYSMSMFNGEYLNRIEDARKKAADILAFLGLSGE